MTARLLLSSALVASAHVQLDTSLSTVPVGYYGSSWPVKTEKQIAMLSRQRLVILMQEDGECWERCCPHPEPQKGKCQSGARVNASRYPGCDPSCDQLGKQNAVFARVKAAARAAGRREPHAVLYMNSVYDWPFDAAHADGADVKDIHGVPHAEQCDPGIFPSYFRDYGQAAGRRAFLGAMEKYIVNGTADGVYLDCFDQMPVRCNKAGTCTASRNARPSNRPSIVSKETVDAYITGKKATLRRATELVARGTGGLFTAKTWNTLKSHDPYGANAAITGESFRGSPQKLINYVRAVFGNGYRYLLVTQGYSLPNRAAGDLASQCSDFVLASFLLALEPGCFLICNGWDPVFEQPLGRPDGPATTHGGVMRRSFASGVVVEWWVGTRNATISWPRPIFT